MKSKRNEEVNRLCTKIKHNSCVQDILVWRGAWVSHSGKCLTSAPGMISQLVSSSLTSGTVLKARSLEPALDSVSPSLSLCPSPAPALSLSLSKLNKN